MKVLKSIKSKTPPLVVLKFYFYMATVSNAFVTPLTATHMELNGLTLAQMGTVGALFWVGMTFGEIPTGYLGDRLGRRASLFAATSLIGISVIIYGYLDSFLGFALVNLSWAVGVTFRSGSLGAWLYEALEERLDADEYARISGRGGSIVLTTSAVGALAGGRLYEIDPQLPFILTGVLSVLGVFVLLSFPKVGQEKNREDNSDLGFREALSVVRDVLGGSELRWFVVYVGVLYVAHEVVGGFVQPAALRAGVSVGQIGLFYAVVMGLSAAASATTGWIKERIGIARWFALAPLLVGIPLLATLYSPVVALPAMACARIVDKVSGPLKKQYVNDRTGTKGRATVLSAMSMLFGVAAVPAEILGGGLGDVTSLPVVYATVGGLTLLFATVIYSVGSPLSGGNQRVTETPSD
jgi:MFS family permease